MLVTKSTNIKKGIFPVIDVHSHLRWIGNVEQCLAEMDAVGIQTVVNLDGGWGTTLQYNLEKFDNAISGRFLTYARIDFSGINDQDWGENTAEQLAIEFEAGAKGLKISKRLGLYWKYKDGSLMKVDDPNLDAIWKTCGEFKRPVEIHISDPKAFFVPLDCFNERWLQLRRHPDWHFYGKKYQPGKNFFYNETG